MRAGRTPDALTAVFLDRDGVINRKAPEGSYVTGPDDLELLPGALEGLRLLAGLEIPLVVVTNQRGIALGRMSEANLERIHKRLLGEVDAGGARLDLILHCPHDHAECDCRKPAIGMFKRTAEVFPSIELERSVVIGDSASDMEAARRIGATAMLVGDDGMVDADLVVPSLLAAAERLTATPR